MNVIETRNLTKEYNKNIVVNEVNLNVAKGQIYGLLGRNGAGKTTIMRMLLNLAAPTKGEIILFGEPSCKNNHSMKRIGSFIESPGFYSNLTGEQNLEIVLKLRGKHSKGCVEHALSLVGLEKESKKKYMDYSFGMKQRLGIAAAIMHEPELLILDEPTNGLDPVGIVLVRNFLEQLCKETGTTIFLSSHILNEIEQVADTIGIIHEGMMIEEVSMQKLRKKNRQYIEFRVSDVKQACFVMEEKFQITDFCVIDNHLVQVFQDLEKSAMLNQAFVMNAIEVYSIEHKEKKLEDYFKELIGGEVIG